jgi:hypothetical protein
MFDGLITPQTRNGVKQAPALAGGGMGVPGGSFFERIPGGSCRMQ